MILYLFFIAISALVPGIIYFLFKHIYLQQLVIGKQGSQIILRSDTSQHAGNDQHLRCHSLLMFNQPNEIKHLTTELELNETQVREALKRYDFISMATSDTIWDWDIQKDSIVYNGGIYKMFGYTTQQVQQVRSWWMNNIHPQDVYHVNQMLELAFMRGKQNVELMYRYRGADGSYKYIFDRAFIVYNEAAHPVRMIGSMQDETRRYEEENRITKAIIEAQERERQQMGMELHDNVNQILSAASLHLGMVNSGTNVDEAVLKTVVTAKKYITEAIDEIRRLSHQLAPASDTETSLCELIRNLLKSINVNDQYKVSCKRDFQEADIVSKETRVGLYRILQEQLNNIIKHAKASSINIEITQEGDLLHLTIKDDGVGFDTSRTSYGIGFENIRRRVKYLNGMMQISSQPHKGCVVKITVPVQDAS